LQLTIGSSRSIWGTPAESTLLSAIFDPSKQILLALEIKVVCA
jgi:hypothetical protein